MAPTDVASEILDALAHPQRRRLLLAVLEQFDDGVQGNREDTQEPTWQVDLHREADRIEPMQVLGRDAPDQVRIQLVHNHLPKLEAAGLIEWDPASRTVGVGPRMEAALPILEAVRDTTARWDEESELSMAHSDE